MSDSVRRLDPQKDLAAAPVLLGCAASQVGPCARCQGLTVRYGQNARPVCAACRGGDPTLVR